MNRLKWHYYLFMLPNASNFNTHTMSKTSKILFKPSCKVKVPTPINIKQVHSSKSYFWYLFFFIYQKPCVYSYKKNINLLSGPSLTNTKTRQTTSTFRRSHFYYSYSLINNVRNVFFNSPRLIFKTQVNSFLFSIHDASYSSYFIKSFLLQNINLYLIFLKLYIKLNHYLSYRFFFEIFGWLNWYNFKKLICLK